MAKVLGLPPVNLNADDVPDNVRKVLDEFNQARGRAGELGAQLDRLGWNDERRGKLTEEHESALVEVAEAHARLASSTIAHGRVICDYAGVQFNSHVARARELLQQAEAEMVAAAGSARLAAVAASRSGRPVLTAEGQAGDRAEGRREAMFVVSELRGLLGKMPEGL